MRYGIIDIMPTRDKKKQAKYANDYYHRNKELVIKKARIAERKKKDAVQLLKNKPCLDCGKIYPPCVMDFDHIGNNKEINISTAIFKGWSLKRIENEINKCELVCSNCHRIRTAIRGNWKQ